MAPEHLQPLFVGRLGESAAADEEQVRGLFALDPPTNGPEVEKGANQDTARPLAGPQGPGAIGRGADDGLVGHPFPGEFPWGISQIKIHTSGLCGAITFAKIAFPEPVLSYAVQPKSRGDEEKISGSLQRLQEEDPTIRSSRDPQTKELLLSGQGQLHIEVTVAKMKRRFGVEVNLKPPKIPYRETITASTEAQGRHKKQTGGHGQFGDCTIKMEPLPRGADFEFVDDIFGGAIPRQYVPAVEKGIQDTRLRGYLAGYPVVDFRVTVTDGSYHDVDSSEMAFRLAGRLAFRDGMSRAKPTILEPIMNVEVYAPSDFAGDLMGDLNGRRGRISGMDTRGGMTVIKAQVPMSEMLTYEQQLTSATGGRGSYHMEYSHYEEAPRDIQAKIIAAHKAEKGEAAEEEE